MTLKRTAWMVAAALSGCAVLLTATDCGNSNNVTCGTGTKLDTASNSCIASGAGATCGANTQLNTGTNTCDIQSSACAGGTTFDTASHSCMPPGMQSKGTLVFQSPISTYWGTLFWKDPNSMQDCGTQTNGDLCPVDLTAGGGCNLDTTKVPDNTPLFMADGSPYLFADKAPVIWLSGSEATIHTANDHQITVGEWKQCKASYAIYKNPPSGKKNYLVSVDVTSCVPNVLMTVWNSYGLDNTQANFSLTTPVGGIPNVLVTGPDGSGHFEREIDPNVYYKSGTQLNGSAHAGTCVANCDGGMPVFGSAIPDLTQYPDATTWVDLSVHNLGQTNGNAGFCITDNSGNCLPKPSPDIYLPGNLAIDWSIGFFGVADTSVGCNSMKLPLSMVQPY